MPPPSSSDTVFTRFDTATFALSVAELDDLRSAPLDAVPEVAFVGRSNAGKSTSINVLVNRTRLAFASKTPGRTQMLNFFALSQGKGSGTCGYLVDLPGYGFAKVDAVTRQRWNELVGGYLTQRPQLRGVVLVMDSRRPLLAADEDLIGLLCQRVHVAPVALHLLLSKADQIKTMERRAVLQKASERALALPLSTSVQLFSAKAREGVDTLREQVGRMLAAAPS